MMGLILLETLAAMPEDLPDTTEDFEVPTDILPDADKTSKGISGMGEVPYVDLVCYDAWLAQPGDVIKTAFFKISNNGNIYATAPFYMSILMDGNEVAYKVHLRSLRPNRARFCSKTFYYSPNGWHTFQCWTDSTNKFYDEPDEDNNFDPRPPEWYWII